MAGVSSHLHHGSPCRRAEDGPDPELRYLPAAVLDLDGVVRNTPTSIQHAWKRLLGDVLRPRAQPGDPVQRFDVAEDDGRHVDGRHNEGTVGIFMSRRVARFRVPGPGDRPKLRVVGLDDVGVQGSDELFASCGDWGEPAGAALHDVVTRGA